MSSLRSRLLLSPPVLVPLKLAMRRIDSSSLDRRRAFVDFTGKVAGLPSGIQRESIKIGPLPGEWLRPGVVSHRGIILYLHGGGYTMGSLVSHRSLAARIAVAARKRLLLLDYRLAPEHPFPAAIEDAVFAYRWLLEKDVSPLDIALAGDSAGGGLVMATLVSLRDENAPLPAAAVCLSPWTDLAITGESYRTKSKADPCLTSGHLREIAQDYLQDTDPHNPAASPIYADLHHLPPLLIQVGSREILLNDATRLASRARDEGVEVTLEIWSGMIHVWQMAARVLPEARQALENIGGFLCQHLEGPDEQEDQTESSRGSSPEF
jgi:monoterpene epsilon-lactone hydrolase